MGFGAVANQRAALWPQIHRKAQPVRDDRLSGNQLLAPMQRGQFGITQDSLPAPEPDLIKPHAGAHQHGKRARADFGIKRAMIALWHAIKFYPVIGDDAGEQIQPPRRAFGIGNRLNAQRQRQAFHQGHDIDTALFQHGAIGQIHLVHFKFCQTIGQFAPFARKERRAHTIGTRAKAQIKAGRLDRGFLHRRIRQDHPLRDHGAQFLRRQNPGFVHCFSPT